MNAKKRPDREGLGEIVGSPTTEVSIRNWPAARVDRGSEPVLWMGTRKVLRSDCDAQARYFLHPARASESMH